ncbi:MAG: N-acetylmuramoyl-L-alanine amidase family protein [Defluviitaleaceae bacterium]|nr:N-acetylmuramoyl-L-alanine amidase family protein [Defluviitaleaceae bacterium]
MNRRWIIGMLILSLLFSFLPINTYDAFAQNRRLFFNGAWHDHSARSISLNINGNTLQNLPMSPLIFNGHTLVPARQVFEPLGATISWDEDRYEVHIEYGQTIVALQQDNLYARVGSENVRLPVSPKIISADGVNGQLMIPTRFVAEAIDLLVDWDDDTSTVSIAAREAISQQPPSSPPAQTSQRPNSTGLARDVSPAPIQPENHPETRIINIDLPTAENGFSFGIQASSAISRVDKMLLWDNRLVLDIHNSEMALARNAHETPNTPANRIRAAQHELTPVKITRVVLDLNSAVDYIVSISGDRRQININFIHSDVTNVTFSTNGTNDFIHIEFDGAPSASLLALANPHRIFIDVPTTRPSGINVSESALNGRFVSSMTTENPGGSITRIVLAMRDDARYEKQIVGNTLTIQLSEPTYRNIFVDIERSVIRIAKTGNVNINVNSVQRRDLYHQGQYVFTLPGDFSTLLGYGRMPISTQFIESVYIRNNAAGQTEIIINQNQILVYDITEDANFIYITPMSPRQRYRHVVLLDPGHGGDDPGASANGLVESELVLDIVLRVLDMFDGSNGIKAYSTRIDNTRVNNVQRAVMGNQAADLFVSVHFNSVDLERNPAAISANGTEVYYFHRDGVPNRLVAEVFQRNLVNRLATNDRGVRTNSFTVLTNSTIPAVLLELAFLTNPEEAARIGTNEFRQRAAEAIYESIVEVFATYRLRS